MRLAEMADAALWIGKEMMETGGDSASIEEALHSFVFAYGYKSAGALVLPKSIVVTLSDEHGGIHTKMEHINDVHPNFERLSLICEYAKNPSSKDFYEFKKEVLAKKPPFHLLSFVAVPVGCAAFSVLLGCDLEGAFSVFLASYIAFLIKSEVLKFGLSMMIVNLVSAFVATLCAFGFSKLFGAAHLAYAQAAATFFLIPGIQLINTFEDMINGHYLNGAARGLRAMFLSFGIVFGATLAILAERSVEAKGLGWIF